MGVIYIFWKLNHDGVKMSSVKLNPMRYMVNVSMKKGKYQNAASINRVLLVSLYCWISHGRQMELALWSRIELNITHMNKTKKEREKGFVLSSTFVRGWPQLLPSVFNYLVEHSTFNWIIFHSNFTSLR